MENLKAKRKLSFANRSRQNLADISNKIIKEGDISSRSRFEFSDSEFLESGIVSRAQSPGGKSGFCKNETETVSDLSCVSESEQFLELTLQSGSLFLPEKLRSSLSSVDLDFDSTMAPKSKKSLSLSDLPGIGFLSTTVFCSDCGKDVHTKLDYVAGSAKATFLKMVVKLMPFCEVTAWAQENMVHKCPECFGILGKGRL